MRPTRNKHTQVCLLPVSQAHPEVVLGELDYGSPRIARRKRLHQHAPRIGRCLLSPEHQSYCMPMHQLYNQHKLMATINCADISCQVKVA